MADLIFDRLKPDLVVLSPGPGTPTDFDCAATIKSTLSREIPLFGVCLGMQAIVQSFGGSLLQLDTPMHGKPSRIEIAEPGVVFSGLHKQVTIGRYHSLYADPQLMGDDFNITARTDDGVIMGVEHKTKPIAGVQFHPESIMSLGGDVGMRMIENVVAHLARR